MKNLFFLIVLLSIVAISCGPKVELAKEMTVKSVLASSTLDESDRPDKYSAYFLIDRDGSTSWCEADKELGINEFVIFKLAAPIQFNELFLYNGWQTGAKGGKMLSNGEKTDKIAKTNFENNPLVSHIEIESTLIDAKGKKTVYKSSKPIIVPTDNPYASIKLPKTFMGQEIKIKIKFVKKSEKKSWAKDTCLTEIALGYQGKDAKETISPYKVSFLYNDVKTSWNDFRNVALNPIWSFIRDNSYFKWLLEDRKARTKYKYQIYSSPDATGGLDIVLQPNNKFIFIPRLENDTNISASGKALTHQVNAIDGAAMRDKADINGNKIAVVPNATQVSFIEETEEVFELMGKQGKWMKVDWNGKEGWLFSGLLVKLGEHTDNKTTSPVDENVYVGDYTIISHNKEEGYKVKFAGTRSPGVEMKELEPHFKCTGSIRYLNDADEIKKIVPDFGVDYDSKMRYVLISIFNDQCESGKSPKEKFLKILRKL